MRASTHRRVVDQAAELPGEVALQRLRRRLDALGVADVDGDARQALRMARLLGQPRNRVVGCTARKRASELESQCPSAKPGRHGKTPHRAHESWRCSSNSTYHPDQAD
jgi:hypothetical protein